ncbi:hypothetical protein Bca4012_064882 [Brassica carinata]
MQEYLWGRAVDALRMSSSSSATRIRVFKREMDVDLTISVEEEGNVFTDTFEGVKLRWILRCHQIGSTKLRCYELTFPKKAKEMVIASYLPFISREAASTRQRMKLFSVDEALKWTSVNLNHPIPQLFRPLPSTFRLRRKSSLVAAMANYLKADVYYLDLSQVSSNSQLQTLLMETTNSSILLLEDIDCLPEFKKRSFQQVDETMRIIVFTATNKEKLGSALLGAGGRIDVHIHMPNCTPDAFETLASNYLNITTHELFNEIKASILETEVSPAELAEQLLGCGPVDNVLERLVEFLAAKKVEKGKAQEA